MPVHIGYNRLLIFLNQYSPAVHRVFHDLLIDAGQPLLALGGRHEGHVPDVEGDPGRGGGVGGRVAANEVSPLDPRVSQIPSVPIRLSTYAPGDGTSKSGV